MRNSHDRGAVPSWIEVRHLKLVRAVGESGSVTRAAGVLHLSQSAVSHQLLDLERDLGGRLFDRIGKRMVPTPLGAHLIAGAHRLLAELVELERSVDARQGAPTPTPLRLTSSCFTSYNWLPAALAHFARSHPGVELTIVLEATRRAVPALVADEVDFAIVTDPPRDDTWECVEVIASELVALASPQHPITGRTRRGVLRWGALHDCEILVPDIADHDLARLDDAVRTSWQRESGTRPNPITVRKIPLSEALLELARAGAGVAIVDRWTVPRLDRRLRALPLSPHAPRTFHAVWRRANPRRLPMRDLTAIVKTHGARALAGHRRPKPRAQRRPSTSSMS
jgi:LysR family transcriptional regulator, regulator for metE and metH